MDPYTISPHELIDKEILIEIPKGISSEDYQEMYKGYGSFYKTAMAISEIPGKEFYYSPHSLSKLYDRFYALAESTSKACVDRLRLQLEHFILTTEQRIEYANKLVKKYSKDYLPEDEIGPGFYFELYFDPVRLKLELTEEEELYYYIINNEYDELQDIEMSSCFFFKALYKIIRDKLILDFVKEEVLEQVEQTARIEQIVKMSSSKGITAGRKVMLLNEYGIIDFLLDAYTNLSINKLSNMLVLLLDEKIDAIRQPISAIRSVKGEQNKNNPYKSASNENWLSNMLSILRLPQRKNSC